MAREATKAAGNIWYQARLKAAACDSRLRSREGAAELLGMSVSSVADAELGLSKVMPVDKAVLMADRYHAPHLLRHYCMEECPIGRTMPLSAEIPSVERITLQIVKQLRLEDLEEVQDKLVEIAEDGEISEEEKPDLREIIQYFDRTSVLLCKLKNLANDVLEGACT